MTKFDLTWNSKHIFLQGIVYDKVLENDRLLHFMVKKQVFFKPMTICLILSYDTFNRQEFLHDHSNVEFWIDSLDSRKQKRENVWLPQNMLNSQ